MKQIFFAFAFVLLTGPLAACGFTPLYATGAGTGKIAVEQIDGRSGHALRKALLQRLAPGLPGVDGPATLTIVLDENLQRLTLKPDEAASRTDIVVQVQYVLAVEDNAYAGTVNAETTFNVPDEPFADIAAQIDGSDRAMTLLARRIVDDLRVKMVGQK